MPDQAAANATPRALPPASPGPEHAVGAAPEPTGEGVAPIIPLDDRRRRGRLLPAGTIAASRAVHPSQLWANRARLAELEELARPS